MDGTGAKISGTVVGFENFSRFWRSQRGVAELLYTSDMSPPPSKVGPRQFLETLGCGKVQHDTGKRRAQTAAPSTVMCSRSYGCVMGVLSRLRYRSGCLFLEHLSGVQGVLQSWNEPEYVCNTGLFHSVYGTELFQVLSV